METVENKYITLAYKLYTIENGEKEFTEEAPAEHPVSYTHLRAHETGRNLVCRLLLEKKKKQYS